MQIVLIHGQNHKGASYHMAQSLVHKLGDSVVSEFFLPKDMPFFCSGCYRCLNEALESCPHHDRMRPILESLFAADLMIFTTPVYCLRASGSMKAFLDHCFVLWMPHRPDGRMFHKKAVILTAAAGMGMKKAAADIRTSVSNWGTSKIWFYGARTAAMNWEGVSAKNKETIEHNLTKLAGELQKVRKPRVSLGRKLFFSMMRLMQLKNCGTPQDKVYWESMGWLKKKRPWK